MSWMQLMSFDGQPRRNHAQEAMLNTLNQRERFLQQLEETRKARIEDTKRRDAASKVQKFYRRHHERRRILQQFRQRFDELVSNSELKKVQERAALITMFYVDSKDSERLLALCSELITLSRQQTAAVVLPDSARRAGFARRVLQFLHKTNANSNFAIPVRFFEVFCDMNDYSRLCSLTKYDYYSAHLHLLMNAASTSLGPTFYTDAISEDVQTLPPRIETLCQRLVAPLASSDVVQRIAFYRSLLKRCFDHSSLQTVAAVVLPFLFRSFQAKSLLLNDALTACVGLCASETMPCNFAAAFFAASLIDKFGASATAEQQSQLLRMAAFYVPRVFEKTQSVSSDSMETDDENSMIETLIVTRVRKALESSNFSLVCAAGMKLCADYRSLVRLQSAIRATNALYLFANDKALLETLWTSLVKQKGPADKTRMECIKSGISLVDAIQRDEFCGTLSMFCAMLKARIQSIDDSDWSDGHPKMPFTFAKLLEVQRGLRDACLGLIDLAHPEDVSRQIASRDEVNVYSALYDDVVGVLQSMYRVDERIHFLPHNFWTEHNRQVVIQRSSWNAMPRRSAAARRNYHRHQPFAFVRFLHQAGGNSSSDDESDNDATTSNNDVPMSASDLRNLSIMRSVPFLVPFMQRVNIFHELLNHDRQEKGVHGEYDDMASFAGIQRHGLAITVRREALYDDSFETLSTAEISKIRDPIRVSMINWAGSREAGIDGGGIFREFMTELLRAGFDVNKGLFAETHERTLYPSPAALQLYPGDYLRHFHFMGRMLGKMIYEKQMFEFHFAEFFLAQLQQKKDNFDMYFMKTYDPQLYFQLHNMVDMDEADIAALSLDFSILQEELGQALVVDLKPNGRNIAVTKANHMEFIQLYVNYYLIKRIEPMVDAMRRGISEMVDPSWLSMFSTREVQMLMSGVDEHVDVSDMRRHCEIQCKNVPGGEEYAALFWEVVRELEPMEKRALIKFITGCSRPPIEGFKALMPRMGIQLVVEDESRLPMSWTCMNFMKLPVYKTKEKLVEKLRYAISAGAGFELS